MRKLLCGTVAVVGIVAGNSAMAADMPAYKAPVVREVLCDYNRFNGKYVGANVGWVQYNQYLVDQNGFLGDRGIARTDDGWAGGVQAGWNWQKHCTVFGVEIDWSWSNAKLDTAIDPGGNIPKDSHSSMKWYGTARTKAGIVVDSLLLYVTGGLAWANFKNSESLNFFVTPPPSTLTSSVSFNDTKWGWTFGAGAEYAWTPKISIFSELMFMSFPEKNYTTVENPITTGGFIGIHQCPPFAAGVTRGTCQWSSGEQVWVSRLGINVKLDWDRGVVARY